MSVPKNSVAENKVIAAVAQLAEMPNLVSLFLARAAEQGEAPFLSAKRQGAWVAQSWRAVADQVCLLAQALRGLGLNPGDRVMLVDELREKTKEPIAFSLNFPELVDQLVVGSEVFIDDGKAAARVSQCGR